MYQGLKNEEVEKNRRIYGKNSISNTKQNWHEVITEQIKRIKDKKDKDQRHKLNKMPIKIVITSIIFIGILFVIIYYGPIYIKEILNWQDKLFGIVFN